MEIALRYELIQAIPELNNQVFGVKLELYRKEAQSLENITFLGRLGTYRYMDMHQVIKEAMKTVRDIYNN